MYSPHSVRPGMLIFSPCPRAALQVSPSSASRFFTPTSSCKAQVQIHGPSDDDTDANSSTTGKVEVDSSPILNSTPTLNSMLYDGMRLVQGRRGRTNSRARPSPVHVQTVETSNMFQELECYGFGPDVLFGTTPGPAEEAMSGVPNYDPQPPHGGAPVRSSSVRSRSFCSSSSSSCECSGVITDPDLGNDCSEKCVAGEWSKIVAVPVVCPPSSRPDSELFACDSQESLFIQEFPDDG